MGVCRQVVWVILKLFPACWVVAASSAVYAETDLLQQIVAEHSKLRDMSSNLTGEAKRYRAETPLAGAADNVPAAIGRMQLRIDGQFWRRDGKYFRADFVASGPGIQAEVLQSAAVDLVAKKSFQFMPTLSDPHTATLSVWESPSADDMRSFASTEFLWPLDSLWSTNGTDISNMLQRPDTTVSRNPYEGLEEAVYISSKPDEYTETTTVLDPEMHYCCRYVNWLVRTDSVSVERQVWIEPIKVRGNSVVPESVVEVVDMKGSEGGSYTAITLFNTDVEQVQVKKLESGVDEESFRDLSRDYEIFRIKPDGPPEVKGRVFAANRFEEQLSTRWSIFTVLGGIALVCGLVVAMGRLMSARK